jgi:hypothetical protein
MVDSHIAHSLVHTFLSFQDKTVSYRKMNFRIKIGLPDNYSEINAEKHKTPSLLKFT